MHWKKKRSKREEKTNRVEKFDDCRNDFAVNLTVV